MDGYLYSISFNGKYIKWCLLLAAHPEGAFDCSALVSSLERDLAERRIPIDMQVRGFSSASIRLASSLTQIIRARMRLPICLDEAFWEPHNDHAGEHEASDQPR